MVSMKCALCAESSKGNILGLNENILGEQLSRVISRICDSEKQTTDFNEKLCTKCVVEVLHLDHLLSKVRNVFGTVKNAHIEVENLNTSKANTSKVAAAKKYLFVCNTCEYESWKLSAYRKHMLTQHDENVSKPYLCKLCNTSYMRLDFYERHQAQTHGVQGIIIKQEITEVYENVENGEKEEEAIEKNAQNTEEEAIEKDAQNTEEVADKRSADDKHTFKCPDCTFKSKQPVKYKNHMIKVHNYEKNSVYRCTQCKKSYGRVHAYFQHVEINHNPDGSARLPLFSCNICHRKFYKNLGLMIHMKSHASNMVTNVMTDETMLNGCGATSTPLNKKNNSKTDATNTTSPSKKKTTKNNSLDKTASSMVEQIKLKAKRKYSDDNENNSNYEDEKKKKLEVEEEEEGAAETNEKVQQVEFAEIFNCKYCNKVLKNAKKLQRHITKKHDI